MLTIFALYSKIELYSRSHHAGGAIGLEEHSSGKALERYQTANLDNLRLQTQAELVRLMRKRHIDPLRSRVTFGQ